VSDWIDVAPVGELAPGSWRVVEVEGVWVAVFNVDGNFLAVEDICTHDGGELAGGELNGEEVVCPRHGARFCLRTGAVLCAPAYDDIDTFRTRVENGIVQVTDERVT